MAGDGRLVVSLDPRRRVELADPDGHVRALLELVAEGRRDVDSLIADLRRARLDLRPGDVTLALEQLDGLGWLDDATAPSPLDGRQRERYFSNLAFFDAFTTLERGREQIQRALLDAHVLVLGAGGLGSSVIQNLVGLGVGRLTIVDFDVVEVRNFVRQFTYTPGQLGADKAAEVAGWVRAFDPTVDVRPVQRRIDGPADLVDLVRGSDRVGGPDLVVSAIDRPDDIDLIVNAVCVPAGVPYIRGGLAYLQGLYWSVDPGRSACRQCLQLHREREAAEPGSVVGWPQILRPDNVNRGIGPVATILGGLIAMEALRYLSALSPPVSAATYQLVDFATDCHLSQDAWAPHPDCAVCAAAPSLAGSAAEKP
jgi:molybdopterin/thiamine biosynthesis adenylyltransferase